MDMKKIFLLFIFQDFFLGFVCQRGTWTYSMTALLGSCVELPCNYNKQNRKISVVWYADKNYKRIKILNPEDPSSIVEEYRNRTSLAPGEINCTLRIDPVRRDDDSTYYGETRTQYASGDNYNEAIVHLSVIYSPTEPQLLMSEYLMEEHATTVVCSLEHTCGSSPPSLQWNKPGQITKQSVSKSQGSWKEYSELTYIPSYLDDETPLQCTATYANGLKTETTAELKIRFAPRDVTVTITETGNIMEGTDVNLVCTSISKPEANTYEWYKGQNKTKLPDRKREITVRDVTRNTEPYSCAVTNTAGRGESALREIPVQYEGSGHSYKESCSNIILLAVIGTVCLLLLLLLVYIFWRKRCRKVNGREVAESPNATYSTLVKNDIANS